MFDKVFSLDTTEATPPEAREVTRLASIDTPAALAAVIFDAGGKPPIDAEKGLAYFAGVSARGYGQVGFPTSEGLAFAQALDALAGGGSVTPEAVTLATLTATGGRLSMVENLLNAAPYVGADGTVIGIKVSGSNHEGSSKPKGTLIATAEIATVCWFISFMLADYAGTSEADKATFAKLAKKHEAHGAKVIAAFKALAKKK